MCYILGEANLMCSGEADPLRKTERFGSMMHGFCFLYNRSSGFRVVEGRGSIAHDFIEIIC
jgi:hypothetical protein